MRTLLFTPLMVFLASCGPGKDALNSENTETETTELHRYEASFAPSDYDQNVEALFPETLEKKESEGEPGTSPLPTRPPEIVSGFRVQLIASSNIDEANQMKMAAETLFPGEWFYLVYDAPSYKLRGGNFLARFEADRFAKMLSDKGYKDAWVVPERVYKNPPTRPATPPDPGGKK